MTPQHPIAFDDADMVQAPGDHHVWCLRDVPLCRQNGFGIMARDAALSRHWSGSAIRIVWHQPLTCPSLCPPGSCPRLRSVVPSSGFASSSAVKI